MTQVYLLCFMAFVIVHSWKATGPPASTFQSDQCLHSRRKLTGINIALRKW